MRVNSAALRPQPIATSGHGASKPARSRGAKASRPPGMRRGANHAHGARSGSAMTRADTPSAAASASAWRSLPAAPSLMTQAEWGGRDMGFAIEKIA
jgi:hypothetical protein